MKGGRNWAWIFSKRIQENQICRWGGSWEAWNSCSPKADDGTRGYGLDYSHNLALWNTPAALVGEDIAGPLQPSGLGARILQAARQTIPHQPPKPSARSSKRETHCTPRTTGSDSPRMTPITQNGSCYAEIFNELWLACGKAGVLLERNIMDSVASNLLFRVLVGAISLLTAQVGLSDDLAVQELFRDTAFAEGFGQARNLGVFDGSGNTPRLTGYRDIAPFQVHLIPEGPVRSGDTRVHPWEFEEGLHLDFVDESGSGLLNYLNIAWRSITPSRPTPPTASNSRSSTTTVCRPPTRSATSAWPNVSGPTVAARSGCIKIRRMKYATWPRATRRSLPGTPGRTCCWCSCFRERRSWPPLTSWTSRCTIACCGNECFRIGPSKFPEARRRT